MKQKKANKKTRSLKNGQGPSQPHSKKVYKKFMWALIGVAFLVTDWHLLFSVVAMFALFNLMTS